MVKRSAGILLHRSTRGVIEVLLVHPGGPLWSRRDHGAWQIPKGLVETDEDLVVAALREFEEETGHRPKGRPRPLGEIRQKGGKTVVAFAIEGDWDPSLLVSNMFEMEWPPRSGRTQEFPEVDRARWFTLAMAREYMLESQTPFLDRIAPGAATPAE